LRECDRTIETDAAASACPPPTPTRLTKIHLRFGTGFHFHPHKGHRLRLEQLPHEALHGMVTTSERVVANQILINPLRRQSACTAT